MVRVRLPTKRTQNPIANRNPCIVTLNNLSYPRRVHDSSHRWSASIAGTALQTGPRSRCNREGNGSHPDLFVAQTTHLRFVYPIVCRFQLVGWQTIDKNLCIFHSTNLPYCLCCMLLSQTCTQETIKSLNVTPTRCAINHGAVVVYQSLAVLRDRDR